MTCTRLSVDPGGSHLAFLVGEWEGEKLVGLPLARVVSIVREQKHIAAGRDRAHHMSSRIPALIQDVFEGFQTPLNEIIVEGQNLGYTSHKRNKSRRQKSKKTIPPSTVVNLAQVAGALKGSLGTYFPGCALIDAPTEDEKGASTGPWSRWGKDPRHERYLDHTFAAQAEMLAAALPTQNKRHYGDLLDCLGMQLWVALGRPKAGV